MNEFYKEVIDLEALESVDLKIFHSDSKVSQEVCNFILALGIIFNDLKDLLFFKIKLEYFKPDKPEISRQLGVYGGIDIHILKILLGLIHETMNMIRDNIECINDSYFQDLINKLPDDDKEAWNELVSISLDKPKNTQIGEFLLLVRNKVGYHYDPKCIFSGYKHFFDNNQLGVTRAYISRGSNMLKTRYYFADAATQGYIEKCVFKESNPDIVKDAITIIGRIHSVIMHVINNFIIKRGFSFREEHG